MTNVRPYRWLGCPIPPKLYHSDCGHLVGCDDPTFDLNAERARRRKAAFELDMNKAIYTGEAYGWRSGSPLDSDVQSWVYRVAQDPCPSNIWHAQWAFDEQEENYARWDNMPEEPDCGCPWVINEADPHDEHLAQIHGPYCTA